MGLSPRHCPSVSGKWGSLHRKPAQGLVQGSTWPCWECGLNSVAWWWGWEGKASGQPLKTGVIIPVSWMEKLKPRKGGHSAPQQLSQDGHLDQCRCGLGIFVFMAFGFDHHLLPVSLPPPPAQHWPGSALGGPLGEVPRFPEPRLMGSSSSLFKHASSCPPSCPRGPCHTPPGSAFGPLLMCQSPSPLRARGSWVPPFPGSHSPV